MTDRDFFAAAALTGLLASLDASCPQHTMVRMAHEWADAMLKERAKTNHDAVPEARAAIADTDERPPNVRCQQTGELRCAASRDGSGTGNTQEPVAWGLQHVNGDMRVGMYFVAADAYEYADACGDTVIPLYRHPQPTLTDEEREAIEVVTDWAMEHLGEDDPGVIALRKLLERLG